MLQVQDAVRTTYTVFRIRSALRRHDSGVSSAFVLLHSGAKLHTDPLSYPPEPELSVSGNGTEEFMPYRALFGKQQIKLNRTAETRSSLSWSIDHGI